MPTDTKPNLSALKKDASDPSLADKAQNDPQSSEAPKTKTISNPVVEAHEVRVASMEMKLAIFESATQIYLKQRPEIAQGAPPKAPSDPNDAKAAETYQNSVAAHLRTAQSYAALESKALWFNLFGESFVSPVDQKGGQP
jgi:hypothetical protein